MVHTRLLLLLMMMMMMINNEDLEIYLEGERKHERNLSEV